MVFFNYSTMQMAAKVVYYGPGLCGKTTNLQWIFDHTSTDSRGEMVSLATETDRTLFFDLLPIDVGTIAGFNTRIQLYTVPGQVFYNTTRKLVLKGVDGVVFVADSQAPMLQANIDSFANLEENLGEMGLSLETIPVVLQYNKRDLPNVMSVEELNESLNRGDWPWAEASAINGTGVFETLKLVSKATLLALKKRLTKGRSEPSAAGRPAPSPPGRPPLKAPLKPPLPPKPSATPTKPPLPRMPVAPPPRGGGGEPALSPRPSIPLPKPPPSAAEGGSPPAVAVPAEPVSEIDDFDAELPETSPVDLEPVEVPSPEPAAAGPPAELEPEVPAVEAEMAAGSPAAGSPAAGSPAAGSPAAGSPAIEEPTVEEPPVEVEVEVEPAAMEPAAVEPAAVEPIAVEPAAVEPAAVEPAAVEPAATGEEVSPAEPPAAAEPAPSRSPFPAGPMPVAPPPPKPAPPPGPVFAEPEIRPEPAPPAAAAENEAGLKPDQPSFVPVTQPSIPQPSAPQPLAPQPSAPRPSAPQLSLSGVQRRIVPTPVPPPDRRPPGPPAAGPPAAALAAEPAAPVAPRPRKSRLGGIDALAELEKLRRQALHPRGGRAAARNGRSEIRREVQVHLAPDDFRRAHRCSLTLQLEDRDEQVLDEVRQVQIDFEDMSSLEELQLRFMIALNTKSS